MSKKSDQLLEVVSGQGQISWKRFKDGYRVLFQRHLKSCRQHNTSLSEGLHRIRCQLYLEQLGHCEFVFSNSNRVHAAPSVLARLPRSGPPTAVLCGRRAPTLIDLLKENAKECGCRIKFHNPKKLLFGIPRAVFVESDTNEHLNELAEAMNIVYADIPPAWSFANYAGSLAEYVASRKWSDWDEPDWKKCAYDPVRLKFGNCSGSLGNLRLCERIRYGQYEYELWRDGQCALVDKNWGRYAVAHSLSHQLVGYDSASNKFYSHIRSPLPKQFGKALALCSGMSPEEIAKPEYARHLSESDRTFNCYLHVPAAIGELVIRKLGQDYERVDAIEGVNTHD